MKELLYVMSGGVLGASLRFYFYKFGHVYFATGFPLATLLVNVIGSFLFGLFLNHIKDHSIISLFFAVGFLGSFTTFSTFSYESVQLLRDGKVQFFVLNILANIVLGLGSFYVGVLINQKI